MTDEITRMLTASILVDEEFPSEDLLPRVAAIPSNNLGHQLLVDYERAASILWSAANEIRKATDQAAWPAALAVGLGILSAALIIASGSPIWGFIIGLGVGGVVFGLASPNYGEAAAKIKARYLKELLTNRLPEASDHSIEGLPDDQWAEYGDGILQSDQILLFFARGNDDPFPGLGWLQSRELFVCPAKSEEATPGSDDKQLFSIVLERLERVGKSLQTSYVGSAIVVDPDTIVPESPWLDANDRPLLRIAPEGGSSPVEIAARDPKASVRAYAGLQVLFPQYMTCASVLVRPFLAEGSASFEILIATLGPATVGLGEVRRRLHIHERSGGKASESRNDDGDADRRNNIRTRLQILRMLDEKRKDYLKSKLDFSDLKYVRAYHADDVKVENEEAGRLRDRMKEWVGRYTAQPNWRERNSLTVTRDFFGTSECRATVRAIYSLVSKGVLNAFDEIGYDISGYRDESGHWTIQADKIENMLVGERITVSQGRKVAPSSRPASSESSQGSAGESG
jgi:hypothetical protein